MKSALVCAALLTAGSWLGIPRQGPHLNPGGSVKTLKVGCPTYWGSLVPALQHTAYADALLSNQYEALVKEGQGGAIQPGLAKSWDVNSDFTSFRFKLDKDRRFANGQLLTATAVKRAWEYGLSLPAKSANSSLQDVLYLVKGFKSFKSTGFLEGLKVVDEETLQVDFEKPFRTALSEFATARMAIFLKDGDVFHGTGPYVITENSESHLHFSKNPFFTGPVGFAEVDVVVVPPQDIEPALNRGLIDVYAFADRAALSSCEMQNKGIACFAGMESGHIIAVPNSLPGRFFSNRGHRQALQYLIHKYVSMNLLPQNYQRNFDIDPQSYLRLQPGRLDHAEAARLVSEGERHVQALIEDSKRNPIVVVTSELNHWLRDLLIKAGVTVSSQSAIVPTKDRVQMYYKTFEPDLIVSGASVSSGDPDGLFHLLARDGAITSPMLYQPKVSDLLEKGRRVLDVTKLDSHYREVSRAVLSEVPVVHVGFVRGMFAYNPETVVVDEQIREREGNQFTLFKPR